MDRPVLDTQTRADMIAAASAAGASEVRVRIGWYRARLLDSTSPLRDADILPGNTVMRLGCPDCVRVVAAADSDLASDWEVV